MRRCLIVVLVAADVTQRRFFRRASRNPMIVHLEPDGSNAQGSSGDDELVQRLAARPTPMLGSLDVELRRKARTTTSRPGYADGKRGKAS